MDPYYATGVCCCKRMYICRVSIDLYSNILIKLITDAYNFKCKGHKNIKSIKVLIPQYIYFYTFHIFMSSTFKIASISNEFY
jgi:hypothetical protein